MIWIYFFLTGATTSWVDVESLATVSSLFTQLFIFLPFLKQFSFRTLIY
jgi:hypothetical protein